MQTTNPGTRTLRALPTMLAMMLVATPAMAQVGVTTVQRSFLNLGFESPNLATVGCRVYIGEEFVPGWTTSHPPHGQENVGGCAVPAGFVAGQQAPIIELWRTPRTNGGLTVNARSGAQLAELNAEQLSRISQNVCLVDGDTVSWRFSHRGRSSPDDQDRMRFLLGEEPIVEVGTTNTGVGGVAAILQGSASSAPGPDGWRDYEGGFTYSGAGGITNIGFEALSGAATTGNFLDEIQVFLLPFIELDGDAAQTVEGTSSGAPALAVSGALEQPLDIVVTVTGGSAVLGEDYTTPSGTSTFTVTVPAGIYDGTENIPLGLVAPGNSDIDGSRTVTLALQPDPATYATRSTSECGEPGASTAQWTILDDDLDLAMEKSADPSSVAPGGTVTYTLVVTHLGGVAGDGAVISDPPVAGLDCSAATLTCSASSGATCPTAPDIAQLQGSGLAIPVLPVGGRIELGFSCVASGTP